MIPFDILSGEIFTEDKMKTEIRILELSPDSFSFRLPSDFLCNHGQIETINLSFFSWEKGEYEEVFVEFFDIKLMEKNDFSETFKVYAKNEQFGILSKKLSREYLHYIDLKINYEDSELSHEMTGMPMEMWDDFTDNIHAQKNYWSNQIKQLLDNSLFDSQLFKPEFCISLENSELTELFLNNDFDAFKTMYFKRWGLEDTPLFRLKYKRIYVGNPYCPCIFPKGEVIQHICEKAKKQGIGITFVFAPISQSIYESTVELIDKSALNGVEIQVNDLGMKKSILEMCKDVRVINGPLLNKQRRDPRKQYSSRHINDNKNNLMTDDNAVYYPFYQTNTGTFCPLYASVNNRNRGNQKRITACDEICADYAFLYPKAFNLIGKYNSLLGFEASLKRVFDYISTDNNNGIERLVINLW